MPFVPFEQQPKTEPTKRRFVPFDTPQTTTYDPDTGSVISHPTGLSAAEIKQNDAIQNLGDNPNNWLAGVKIKSDPTKSIFDDLISFMDRNAEAGGIDSFGIESRKAIVRGVQSGVESIAASPATSVMQAAENYQPEDVLRPQEMSFGAGLLKQVQEPFILGKAWLYKATRSGDGNVVTEAKQDLVEFNARLKHIEAQIPNARHVRNFFKGAQVGTNILSSVGLAITTSPLGAALFQYDLQSTSTYREQREGKTEPLEALNLSALSGGGNGAVEFIGGQVTKKVFGEITGRFTSAVVESLNNAAQEGVQGAIDAAINQNVRQATYAEIFESIIEQIAFGGGFGFGLGFASGNGVKSDEGVNFTNPVGSPEFNKELQEKYGVTEQEAISISEAFVEIRPAMEDAAKQVERNFSSPTLAGSEADTLAVYKAGAEGVPMGEVIKGIEDGLTVSDAISKARQSMSEKVGVAPEAQLQQRIDDATLEAEILAKSEVKDVSEATIAARITKLDSDIQALDAQIDAQETILSQAQLANKATKRIQNGIQKLEATRDKIDEELSFLLTAEEKVVARSQAGKTITERDVAAKEASDNDIIVKGDTFKKAEEARANAREIGVRAGLRKGAKLAKEDINLATKVLVDTVKKAELDSDVEAKLLKSLLAKNLTPKQLLKALPDIRQAIRAKDVNSKIKKLESSIEKELSKKAIGVKNKKGKFTADVQRALDEIKKLWKATKAESETLQEVANATANVDLTPLDILLNRIYAAKANKGEAKLNALDKVLTSIKELKAEGKEGRNAFLEGEEQIAKEVREGLLEQNPLKAKAAREANLIKKTARTFHIPLKDFIQKLTPTNKELRKKLNFSELYADYRGKRTEYQTAAENKIIEDLGFKGLGEFNSYVFSLGEKIKLGEYENARGEIVDFEPTKGEIIDLALKLRQEDAVRGIRGKEIGNAYTDAIIEAHLKQLEQRDIDLVDSLIEIYADQEAFARIADFIEERTGVPFNAIKNYSPIRRDNFIEPVSIEQMMSLEYIIPGYSPSLTKARENSERAVVFSDPIATLMSHIDKREKFIGLSDKIKFTNRTLLHPTVTARIANNYGRDAVDFLRNEVSSIAFTPPTRGWELVNRMVGNFAIAKLAGKVIMAPKQWTSFVSSLGEVSGYTGWVKGNTEFFKDPIGTAEILLSHPAIKERYGRGVGKGNISIEYKVMQDASKASRKLQSITQKMLVFVQAGDFAAVMHGGGVIYHDAIANGSTKEQALKKVTTWINDTQQTTDPDNLSAAQKSGGLKFALWFRSAPMAQFNATIRAIRDFRNSPKSKKDVDVMVRKVAANWVLTNVLFEAISNGFEGEWEEYLRAGLIGPANSLFLVGDLIDAMARTVLGLKVFEASAPGFFGAYTKMQELFNETVQELADSWKDGRFDDDTAIAILQLGAVVAQGATGMPPEIATKGFPAAYEAYTDEEWEMFGKILIGYPPGLLKAQAKRDGKEERPKRRERKERPKRKERPERN